MQRAARKSGRSWERRIPGEMLGAAVAVPLRSAAETESCAEPEPSMPIGRQGRAGCWLPGQGSPHYSWGGVGSSHARCSPRRDAEWFLPNCFSQLCSFFHSNRQVLCSGRLSWMKGGALSPAHNHLYRIRAFSVPAPFFFYSSRCAAAPHPYSPCVSHSV